MTAVPPALGRRYLDCIKTSGCKLAVVRLREQPMKAMAACFPASADLSFPIRAGPLEDHCKVELERLHPHDVDIGRYLR